MATSRRGGRSRPPTGRGPGGGDQGDTIGVGMLPEPTGTTGKYLVLLKPGATEEGMRMLSNHVGVRVTSAAEYEGSAVPGEALAGSEAILFDRLGVALVSTPPDQTALIASAMGESGSPVLAVEEERIVYAISEDSMSGELHLPPGIPAGALTQSGVAVPPQLADYLRGYQDAVNALVGQILEGKAAAADGPTFVAGPSVELEATWGLQATGALTSRYTGKGVRVAVLDTGMDLGHPDFVGRAITAQSFVPRQAVQDRHGHGTHCIGTACGSLRPGQLPRYGVAYEAEIYVAKVLSNQGSGTDSGILAGIEWAIANRCAVISMSLGARVQVGQTFSRIFETVAQRALAAGSLIIAAAGNESQRPSVIAPVGHPANCPSILSVGAVDPQLGVAIFSCGGLNPQGGQVDIAGPGVAVRSSWPRPTLYRTISGTSMATPHVAGIAALHAEANPDMRGGSLGWLLLQSSRRLGLSTRDIGVGLVQAP
jgi:subtilisin